MKLILASTSPYRIRQLRDFGLRFQSIAPKIDEEAAKRAIYSKQPHITPRALSRALAYEKAMSIAHRAPEGTVVIGADQLVQLGQDVLGKPGSASRAVKMLMRMRGRRHYLITSLCVIGRSGGKLTVHFHTETVAIDMRRYTRLEAVEYVRRDQPLNCAGSYKLEKGGLALVKRMKVQDPSSLVGLPLIALVDLLSKIRKPIKKPAKKPIKRASIKREQQ